jgi:hypothetical protein
MVRAVATRFTSGVVWIADSGPLGECIRNDILCAKAGLAD